MSEIDKIQAGVSKVFEHRQNFLVIGLTGRTGSGCSTAAKILSSPNYADLDLPSVKNPPTSHEDRKLRIIDAWLTEKWSPFQIIQVPQIIMAKVLKEGFDRLVQTVAKINGSCDLSSLKAEFEAVTESLQRTEKTISEIGRATPDEIEEAHLMYFATLPTIVTNLKIALKTPTGQIYTQVFQHFGNNIRKSGNAHLTAINPDAIFTIPEQIHGLIRLCRAYNSLKGITRQYFVIDTLRHPYEIRYLRERISSFYAVAVVTDEASRRSRLHALDLKKTEIEALDNEYPDNIDDKIIDYNNLVNQNIQACLELADIYISNINDSNKRPASALTRQLMRYVALMQHPGLVTPTPVERCMQAAFGARANSGCISRQVGAVVTNVNYSVKAVGWNDVPQGQVPCVLRNVTHLLKGNYDHAAYSDYEKKNENLHSELKRQFKFKIVNFDESKNARNLSFCFKTSYNNFNPKGNNQVHTRSLHAEENAFLQISKYGGQGIEGGHLFTTASPCELCAKKAYQLGIKTIHYIDPYPGISIDHVLGSGTRKPELRLFYGAIGGAYHDLYEPIMPFKDELALFGISNPYPDEKHIRTLIE